MHAATSRKSGLIADFGAPILQAPLLILDLVVTDALGVSGLRDKACFR